MKSISIDNCKFGYQCERRWSSLPQTSKEDKERYCSTCRRNVHYCENDEELAAAVRLGHCVAFDRGETRLVGLVATETHYEYKGPRGPYMNVSQKAYFKSLLEHNLNDFTERKSRESSEVRRRRLAGAISEIQDALTRVETDKFGYCIKCGDVLGFQTMELWLNMSLCVNCLSRSVSEGRQNSRGQD